MKNFLEYMTEMFNDVFDFINEEMLFENEVKNNPAVKRQPWPEFEHENKHKTYSNDEFKKYYKKHVEPHINKAEKPFQKVLHVAKTHNAKVLAARKPIDSFHDKVVNRGKAASEVDDILRGAVLTRNKEEAQKVVDNLKKKGHVVNHEYKDFKTGNTSGYGGVHHVTLNVHGVKSEVQIMPKKIWAVKKEQHKLYSKYRSMEHPEQHPDYEKDMAHSRKMFLGAHKKSE